MIYKLWKSGVPNHLPRLRKSLVILIENNLWRSAIKFQDFSVGKFEVILVIITIDWLTLSKWFSSVNFLIRSFASNSKSFRNIWLFWWRLLAKRNEQSLAHEYENKLLFDFRTQKLRIELCVYFVHPTKLQFKTFLKRKLYWLQIENDRLFLWSVQPLFDSC